MGSENEWGDAFLRCDNPVVNQGKPANFLLKEPTRPEIIALIERLIIEVAKYCLDNTAARFSSGLCSVRDIAPELDKASLSAWEQSPMVYQSTKIKNKYEKELCVYQDKLEQLRLMYDFYDEKRAIA